jgi:hypothetical protein
MVRILVLTAALVAGSSAGVGFLALARPASAQSTRMIEGRIVSLQGNQVMLNNGTMVTIPRDVAQPTEVDQGDTVRFNYEVRNGQNIATSIQMMDRAGGLRPRTEEHP